MHGDVQRLERLAEQLRDKAGMEELEEFLAATVVDGQPLARGRRLRWRAGTQW